MKVCRIYALIDPTTNEIRYIGKTSKDLEVRLNGHISKTKLRMEDCYRSRWIQSLLNRNMRPDIVLLEEVLASDWQWEEMWWIAYGKTQGWRLTNTTSGGEGLLNPSRETRNKMSNSAKGNTSHKGKKHSEHTKNKISLSKAGKTLSTEHVNKIKTAITGLKRSEASRKRLSECKQGSKHPAAKLTEENVIDIIRLSASGISDTELSVLFKVARVTINEIKLRKRWRHVHVE